MQGSPFVGPCAFHANAGPHIVPQFTHPLVPALDGRVQRRMAEIWLVSWGAKDGWIASADLKTMAAAMPDCRLIMVPGIGHSMNLESLANYADILAYGSALPGREVAI